MTSNENAAPQEPVRLQKLLAEAGFGSRRACERLITDGRVTVNGKVVDELGAKALPTDNITVDGKQAKLSGRLVYYLLNKPEGIVTSCVGQQQQTTVLDIMKGIKLRVYPVGRLDIDTTGALLLTNDGELAFRLTHPRYGVNKTYLALIDRPLDREQIAALREGVELEDGLTAPAKVWFDRNPTHLEITIHEGRNHQVKRMISAVGGNVVKLHRLAFGHVSVKGLAPGQWRALSKEEVFDLMDQVGM